MLGFHEIKKYYYIINKASCSNPTLNSYKIRTNNPLIAPGQERAGWKENPL